MKKYLIITILIILLPYFAFSINEKYQKSIDSLKAVLKEVKHDTSKVKLLNAISNNYLKISLDSTFYYASVALKLGEKINFKKGIGASYKHLASYYAWKNNYKKAIEYYFIALKIFEEIKANNDIEHCYYFISFAYSCLCNYDKSMEYFNKTYQLYLKSNNKIGISNVFNNIGLLYEYQGIYEKAIEYYIKALKVYEEINDKLGFANANLNIGLINHTMLNHNIALDYINKSLKIYKLLKNKEGISICYNNIGMIYFDEKKYDSALNNLNISLKISIEINNNKNIAYCYGNLGKIYNKQHKYDKALEYYLKSLEKCELINDINAVAENYIDIAILYDILSDSLTDNNKNKKVNYSKQALMYGEKAIKIAKEINALPMVNKAAQVLMNVNKKHGRISEAFKYSEIYIATKDSMFKEEKTKALTEMEVRYKAEKKQIEIDKLTQEKKTQQIIIIAIISGIVLLVFFAIFIVNRLRITHRQKKTIEQQHNIVTEQKLQIEYIHNELTDSIKYGKRIQNALLPNENMLEQKIQKEFFILFKPKDIVSGDFYFVEKIKHWLFIGVADCTGHGVPGAFMSMLGFSFLNEVITKEDIKTSGRALDDLRQYIIRSLQQKGVSGEQKDGMDISFIVLDTDTNIAQFSGANNSLYIISADNNNILKEIKGDKMPVAIHEKMDNFTTHTIQLNKGDIIYLMSDGFGDQFGGSNGKKFLTKNVKQLFTDNYNKPLNEQKEILDYKIENWKNSSGTVYEQTDDITVVGVKI